MRILQVYHLVYHFSASYNNFMALYHFQGIRSAFDFFVFLFIRDMHIQIHCDSDAGMSHDKLPDIMLIPFSVIPDCIRTHRLLLVILIQ